MRHRDDCQAWDHGEFEGRCKCPQKDDDKAKVIAEAATFEGDLDGGRRVRLWSDGSVETTSGEGWLVDYTVEEDPEDCRTETLDLMADAVRRLSERIEANEAEIAKTELKNTCEYGALRERVKSLEDGEKDAITNQTGFADQLVALKDRVLAVERQQDSNTFTKVCLDADVDKLFRKVAVLEEGKPAMSPKRDTVSEAARNHIRREMARELVEHVRGVRGSPAMNPWNIEDWIRRTYLRAEEDRNG